MFRPHLFRPRFISLAKSINQRPTILDNLMREVKALKVGMGDTDGESSLVEESETEELEEN
jgi:hypothetical protein